MGLITKEVTIKPNGPMISYLREKGYDAQWRQPIKVKVEDLSEKSVVKVDATCDYCGELRQLSYWEYNKSIRAYGKYACCKCCHIKSNATYQQKTGYANPFLSPDVQSRIHDTILELYGVDNPMKDKNVQQKSHETLMNNYGVEYPLQSKEVMDKLKNTNQEKYGVNFVSQSKEIRSKIEDTNIQKYGGKSPTSSPEILQKIKNTNNERYGVDYALQNHDIYLKMKQTNLEKYGKEHVMMISEIQEKAKETMYKNNTCPTSTQQKYLHNLYGGELNYPIKIYSCDIAFPEELLYVEYNGSGHWLSVEFNVITEEQFRQKNIIRSQQIARLGYKRIEIISRKDNLPSDSVLLSMLDYARTFFKENPERSWISFDIDNSCIYNAYHKESDGGIPYDFGTLRKIKKADLSTEDYNDKT